MDSNLAIKPGSGVEYGERRFVIMQAISFEAVVARDVGDGPARTPRDRRFVTDRQHTRRVKDERQL
jgi:hypothetical protein